MLPFYLAENMSPRANAGGDKTIYLPCDVIIMNGSSSTDDIAVVKYKWSRDPASLAAGVSFDCLFFFYLYWRTVHMFAMHEVDSSKVPSLTK